MKEREPERTTPPPASLSTDEDGGDAAPEPIPLVEPRDGVPAPLATSAEVADLAARLARGSGPVAVDAERASGYRYGQRAYLVQVRRAGVGTALIDPIAVPDLSRVGASIAGAEWVLHAANQDLPCLAEVGLRPNLLFDTELGARIAGLPKVGLGSLIEELLGYRLEKGHSAADWSTRPLPHTWLVYAALDVEMLIDLRHSVAQRLADSGKLAWAEEEFAAVLGAEPPAARTDPWRRTSGLRALRHRRQLAMLRSLWNARDDLARRRDIAPGRILPDRAMIAAVLADPADADALVRLPVFRGRANRRLIRTWYGALDQGRALPETDWPAQSIPGQGPPPASRWSEREPQAAARLAAVRGVIAELTEAHGVPAENLLTPDLVRRLAWEPPTPITEETIAHRLRDGGAREWQVALTGGRLATAMTEAVPAE